MKRRIRKQVIGCRWLMIAGAALVGLACIGLWRNYSAAVIGGSAMYISGRAVIVAHNWWLCRWHCLQTLWRKKL
jgi:hypothetical protein